MEDLSVGDRVLTDGCSGRYEAVYTFGHLDRTSETNFLKISTHNKDILKVTPNHLVFHVGHNRYVPANQIQAGDVLTSGTVV
jgi:intein/homing endonuclease